MGKDWVSSHTEAATSRVLLFMQLYVSVKNGSRGHSRSPPILISRRDAQSRYRAGWVLKHRLCMRVIWQNLAAPLIQSWEHKRAASCSNSCVHSYCKHMDEAAGFYWSHEWIFPWPVQTKLWLKSWSSWVFASTSAETNVHQFECTVRV